MRFIRSTAAVAAAALLFAACGGGTSPSPADSQAPAATGTQAPAEGPPADPLGVVEIPAGEPVHIGQWGVFSGPNASLGMDSNEGIQVAIEDHGGTILGHDVRLTTEDAQCSPEGGATAGQKLAADSTLAGLIGSTCSDETVGGIKSVTDAGLTTIGPSTTRPALTDPNRDASYAGFLRTAHNDLVQGTAAAQFAFNELGLRKAATIHDGSSYAEELQQVFADEFTRLGGTITIQEAVSAGQTDMRPVLTRIAATQPEFIYYPYFVAEGGYTTAQVKEVPGLENVKTMGADGQFTADFIKAAGAAAEGHYLSSPDFTAFGSGYQVLVDKIKSKFGHPPLSIYHAHAYDAASILMAAIEKVAVQGADGTLYVPRGALREALFATRDFPGVTGTLTCSPNGDCGAPVMAVYQVTAREIGGEWPPEKPIWRQGQ